MIQMGQAFLEVQGNGIVDFTADLVRFQVVQQLIALPTRHAHHVLVKDVPALGAHRRAFQKLGQMLFLNQGVVALGRRLARFRPAVQVRQLDPQEGGLQRVQPRVPAHELVVVARLHAVAAQAAQECGPGRIAGDHHAAVAKASQIFGRIKAEAADGAQRPRALAMVLGPNGLGGIFHDGEVVTRRHVPERIHFRALSEQVDHDDGPRPLGDLVFHLVRIDIEGGRIDVREDRPSAQPADGADRGEERESGQDDLVVGTHTQSGEGQQQGVRAR